MLQFKKYGNMQAEDGTQQMYVDLEYKQMLTCILPVGVAITCHA